ncbi:hypothetical protein ACIA03_10900 [Nocardioides sp. NPDC051685]|uniref:hypothetical protein n=1 Tax=Nocardioides sp. NPDC051685 TaxID=3364334 RepID=UPI00379DDEF0
MRDKAIDGLGRLAFRENWRSSQHGALIVDLVMDAMADENPVVRMSAARAFRAVYFDKPPPARVSLLGELLQGESNRNVRNEYMRLLESEAHESPQEVDNVLRGLANEPESPTEPDPTDDDALDLPVEVLTLLAMRHQTPFATETVRAWATNAPWSDEALRATHCVRGYLGPNSDPAVQGRAFDMVTKAADSSLGHWITKLEEVSGAEPSESEQDELKHSVMVLDSIANQLYFASGAFDRMNGGEDATASRAAQERFADLATPVLITCARSKVSGIVHQVVETLIFLAPLDEKRTLLSTMEAVASDGSYAYDPLSSDVVIPYLKRLLAEHRQLVLFDDEGVAAFRALLSAFASAGNESALELAFTFSDVFR